MESNIHWLESLYRRSPSLHLFEEVYLLSHKVEGYCFGYQWNGTDFVYIIVIASTGKTVRCSHNDFKITGYFADIKETPEFKLFQKILIISTWQARYITGFQWIYLRGWHYFLSEQGEQPYSPEELLFID
jgi:hypothetical protein